MRKILLAIIILSLAASGVEISRHSCIYRAYAAEDAIECDGDQVEYWFDWGDGQTSGWLGLYDSGVICEKTHVWNVEGSYSIKVKARDIFSAESEWSDPLSVSMPKNKSITNLLFIQIFERIIEQFPLLEWLFLAGFRFLKNRKVHQKD